MDLSDTIQPTSDQLDAVDLLGGPRTFTIAKVSKGDPEQPVNIHLAEFDRPWRPGKSMRRVLVACWGPDAAQYVGRRVELFCDPTVVFGGQAVGGTRVRALSHIDRPRRVPLLVSRGKSQIFEVAVLSAVPAAPDLSQRIAAAVKAFAAGGITEQQLTARIGRAPDDWTAADLDDLTALFSALKSGATTKAAEFPEPDQGEDDTEGELPLDGAEAAAEEL